VQAFQQLAAEPEQPGGFGRLVGEQPDVHHRVGTDGRDERITTQHYVAPSERRSSARIHRNAPSGSAASAKNSSGQPGPARRAGGEQQVAEQRPRLPAARRVDRAVRRLDARWTE
jgi:hypothetical protein